MKRFWSVIIVILIYLVVVFACAKVIVKIDSPKNQEPIIDAQVPIEVDQRKDKRKTKEKNVETDTTKTPGWD